MREHEIRCDVFASRFFSATLLARRPYQHISATVPSVLLFSDVTIFSSVFIGFTVFWKRLNRLVEHPARKRDAEMLSLHRYLMRMLMGDCAVAGFQSIGRDQTLCSSDVLSLAMNGITCIIQACTGGVNEGTRRS